jgi:hypothetical protein
MSESIRIGEVVSASTAEFTAQCYELLEPPALGSLVKTRDTDSDIYGLVFRAETHSLDPGRRPIARGEKENTEGDIFRDNPQLAKLLCTDFSVLMIGFGDKAVISQHLPPRPARIHNFVYECQSEEIRAFAASLDFLPLVLQARVTTSVDEVVGACLRGFAAAHDDRRAFMVRAGKELAVLLSGELMRLNSILKGLK